MNQPKLQVNQGSFFLNGDITGVFAMFMMFFVKWERDVECISKGGWMLEFVIPSSLKDLLFWISLLV